jgi:hypothetical protein
MNRRAIRGAKLQRGMALLAMLVVVVMGASYFLVRAFNSQPSLAAGQKARNAEVLNLAKQALIGYVARQATMPGENNPGRLPCPEGSAFVGGSNEGIAAPTVGAPTCASIGRLPWRTLGIDKPLDTASEPLWYVVGPAWRLTTSASTLLINSDTPAPATAGQITVDGQRTVALIIAPGAAMNVQASGLCAARQQVRNPPSPAIDSRDYLECFDAATLTFTTTDPSTSLNDQVLRVTVEDVMPAIEAAISDRIGREIVPVLKSVYGTAAWSLSSMNPLFPYAAPFTDPGVSTYIGATGTYQGLLPFSSQSSTFTWNNAIAPTVTASNPPQLIGTPACDIGAGDTRARCRCRVSEPCSYSSPGTPTQFRMTATTLQNVALGLHQLDSTTIVFRYRPVGGSYTPLPAAASGAFNSDGTARIFSDGTLTLPPGSYEFEFETYIGPVNPVIVGHSLLDPNNPTTGWFVRNEWYRLLYYATTPTHTALGAPLPACTSGVDCLTVTNVTPTSGQRAILVLAGRALPGQTRLIGPGTLTNYLEYDNANLDTTFEQQPISTVIPASAITKTPFNDRGIVIDSN